MSTLSTARKGLLTPGVLAAVLLGAVPLLSACGAGQKAPTRLEYEVADGVQAAAGNVVLRNLQLVADVGDTQGGATTLDLTGVIANNTGKPDTLTGVTATSSGSNVAFGPVASGGASASAISPSAAASSAAPSASALASASASALASASASASAGASASASASASTSTAAGSAPAGVSAPVLPGSPLVLGSAGLPLQVSGLKQPVLPGSLVELTFTFDKAGSTSVAVPVYSLSSRTPGASQTPVVIPTPEVGQEFNEPEYDLRSAAPSS